MIGDPPAADPGRDCGRCPRLKAFRDTQRQRYPDWFNAPVPSFGDGNARLVIVGLAPGLQGANRTGRPFTGDWAGDLLFATLGKFGFAKGNYDERPDDGLRLTDCIITNSVRCVPPENKPTGPEIRSCNGFLTARLAALPRKKVMIALGRIAHEAALVALGLKPSAHRFGHGAEHALPGGLMLIDSYHCSRYNTNTGRLTPEMFEAVFAAARGYLDRS